MAQGSSVEVREILSNKPQVLKNIDLLIFKISFYLQGTDTPIYIIKRDGSTCWLTPQAEAKDLEFNMRLLQGF